MNTAGWITVKGNCLGCGSRRGKRRTVSKHGCNRRNGEASTITVPESLSCNLTGCTTTMAPRLVKRSFVMATASYTQIRRDHHQVGDRFSTVHVIRFPSHDAVPPSCIDYDLTERYSIHPYEWREMHYKTFMELSRVVTHFALLSQPQNAPSLICIPPSHGNWRIDSSLHQDQLITTQTNHLSPSNALQNFSW